MSSVQVKYSVHDEHLPTANLHPGAIVIEQIDLHVLLKCPLVFIYSHDLSVVAQVLHSYYI